MLTFEQYVTSAALEGRSINTMFEERLFALVGTLEKIAQPLAHAQIPYELIGGAAVMVHVNQVEPSSVRNTKDLDIMVNRSDLQRIQEAATKTLNAVHLVFTGEKVRPTQAEPNPPLRPQKVSIHGVDVAVIPIPDLVRMKLGNSRDIDRVHVDDMDLVGLITPQIEQLLPLDLLSRLQKIRDRR